MRLRCFRITNFRRLKDVRIDLDSKTSVAQTYSDAHWTSNSPEADVRILVLVHRMAAARLGFSELYTAFNDHAPESFASGFREGNAWAIKPFLDVLLLLSSAFEHDRQFDLMTLLRTHCPKLDADSVKGVVNLAGFRAFKKPLAWLFLIGPCLFLAIVAAVESVCRLMGWSR
jgi:hypothetical protein